MLQGPDDGAPVGPQVIFGLDRDGLCTMSTGAGLADLGLSPGDLVGVNLLDFYRDNEEALDAIRRVLSGETFSTEREFDGRRLWVYYEPVRDQDGTVTGALGVSTDVTDQRRVEREARAARERTTLLADLSTALGPEVLDAETLLKTAVRAVAEPVADGGAIWLRAAGGQSIGLRAVWRYDEEGPRFSESLTLSPDDEPPPVDIPQDGSLRLRVPLRSRGILLGVAEVARRPGRGAFADEDLGLVAELAERCALFLDIALLLDAQRRAREELVKFQALADASDALIAISDDLGRVLYVNPRLEEYDIDLLDQDLWTAVSTHAGDPVHDVIRAGVEATGRWSGDLTAWVSDEELIVHGYVFRLAHPDTGTDLGLAWIGQDVTELRTTEATLRAVNADLAQFKALVEASPDFIAIADLDGKVKYVNPPGRKLIGMDAEVDCTTTSIPDYLTPEGLEASEQVEQPAVLASGHWEGESTLLNHRGPPIPVAIASFLMRDAETGEPFALATVQRDISERLAAERAMRGLAEQREALLTRLVVAQDAERARIAADVHDDPVQALAAVEVRLELLRNRLRDQAPDTLELLDPVQASVTGATERLRALLFDLEPPDLERGLGPAIRRAAEEIFEGTGTRWTVDSDREPDVPDATRAVAYRIAKEAMNNVRKHASATSVSIAVTSRNEGLEVAVSDDGVGLGRDGLSPAPGHRGVLSMRDRAAVAGGWCSVSSRRQGGTRVTAWLPGPSSPE